MDAVVPNETTENFAERPIMPLCFLPSVLLPYQALLSDCRLICSEFIISQVPKLVTASLRTFPDIRYLTGNYYVGDVSYGYAYRDKKHQPYHIKEGRLRHKYHNGKEWVEEWLPLDSPEITRYYRIILTLHLTSDEDGKEKDYMGLDLIAEFVKLEDPMEFEILSHDVI